MSDQKQVLDMQNECISRTLFFAKGLLTEQRLAGVGKLRRL